MSKDQMRKELAEDDFFPAFIIHKDDEDGMYLMLLPNKETCISYTPVRCVYAYGMSKNTIGFEVLDEQ